MLQALLIRIRRPDPTSLSPQSEPVEHSTLSNETAIAHEDNKGDTCLWLLNPSTDLLEKFRT